MADKAESFIRFLDDTKEELRRYMHDTDWQEMRGGNLVYIQPVLWLDDKLVEAWRIGREEANNKEKS